ncbi:MAG: alpha-amylase family glycosyl hydrolase [Acidimicrobiales bacterium]
MRAHTSALMDRVRRHLDRIYRGTDHDLDILAGRLVRAIGGPRPAVPERVAPPTPTERWDETDAVLITYGDTVLAPGRVPLDVLGELIETDLHHDFSIVHILPFFPYSSDRGFAVIDYRAVDPALGDWDAIDRLAAQVDLMVDLVCNHASSESLWFRQFIEDREPGRRYFVTVEPGDDTSTVVRPRHQPLIHRFDTAAGPQLVWCTFGPDQPDLDLGEPDVLVELTSIIGTYLDHGARLLRLDAVAYLWKQLGTSSIHDARTHETVRLWHTLLEHRAPRAALITETNVPNRENLSYLGSGDEAHLVYNFSLPPLVVDALLSSDGSTLTHWLADLPSLPGGTTLFNFLTSHDGIGVRPAEGILSAERIDGLVEACSAAGGLHGTYDTPSGPRPYELNVTLWDLLSAPDSPADPGPDRFVCAHAIMASLAGVPAVYLNTLVAAGNDTTTAERTGQRRDINRGRMDLEDVRSVLRDASSPRGRTSRAIRDLLAVRRSHRAFHPEARQFVRSVDDRCVCVQRLAADGDTVVALANVSADTVVIDAASVGIDGTWVDLLDPAGTSTDAAIVLAPHQPRWVVAG